MENLDFFSTILSAGAMGISLALIYYVYQLLKQEQAKEEPRKGILVAIYVFMVFALLMTPLAMLIESNKEDGKFNKLLTKLQNSSTSNKYIVDKMGDPESINLKISDSMTISLAKTPGESMWESQKRSFKLSDDKEKLFISTSQGTDLGYILIKDLESQVHISDIRTDPDEMLYSGIKRGGVDDEVKFSLEKKVAKAIEVMFMLLNDEANNRNIRKSAFLGLVQEDLLKELTVEQLDLLIKQGPLVRNVPYLYWDLAQAYDQRSKTLKPGETWSDFLPLINGEYRKLCDYYETPGKMPAVDPQLQWYKDAKKALGEPLPSSDS